MAVNACSSQNQGLSVTRSLRSVDVQSHSNRFSSTIAAAADSGENASLTSPQAHAALKHIVDLENAPVDAYHSAHNWLDKHRFYINEEQSSRINSALQRLDRLPREVGEFRDITSRFQEDPEHNDSYFLP